MICIQENIFYNPVKFHSNRVILKSLLVRKTDEEVEVKIKIKLHW